MAGTDGPGRRALPLGEFLAPAPVLALVLLAVNDHWLKGSGALPGWLTGKLSDFAGLFFFPLLLTALFDTILCGMSRATGWRVDYSLNRRKLGAALVLTAALFVPLELSPAWQDFYVRTLGRLGFPSQTVADPTDLLALVMLVPAWLAGRAEIRRVPLGRLDAMARAGATLADVRALHADPRMVDELAAAHAAWLAAPGPETVARVEAALSRVRSAS